jgi:uncharacterized protein
MSGVRAELAYRIQQTRFIDTHEHLLEETTRLAGPGNSKFLPCDDFALLFLHYAQDDLRSAGMPAEALDRFFSAVLEPAAKWRLLEPYWRRCQHTGFLEAVRRTAALLFDEQHWDAAATERITARMRVRARPGFYRQVLAAAGVDHCHVNSLEAPLVCATQYPDLLPQDLSLLPLTTYLNVDMLRRYSGLPVSNLADWHRVLDWTFDHYRDSIVAVKSQAAYARRLDFAPVPASEAAPLFARHLGGERLQGAERKALEDHLLRECIARAQAYGLPIKLHCGYYAGKGPLPLARIRDNAADLCPLLDDFPAAKFILMHIGYPYQDEYIALAKHYPNVWIDLCWAWIVSPSVAVRFVKESLVTAPSNKLLLFGGDYSHVEPIVGHASIARQGLAQALDELVGEGWLASHAALALVEPLMAGNALALFAPPERSSVAAASEAGQLRDLVVA